jgi:Domain of unknown function (DUF4252)
MESHGSERNFLPCAALIKVMKTWARFIRIPVLCAGVGCGCLLAQTAQTLQNPGGPAAAVAPELSPVPLEWVPPALLQLQAQAAVKSSFTLDRNLLGVAAGMMPDSDADVRQTVRKLDGVSVLLLRFGDASMVDPAEVDEVREAYHLRGWKHLVTTTSSGGPVHDGTTDVWLVLDGANVRGAVVLAETPKSLTLVTVAGNLSPVDLLHLRGHFGIPRFDGDGLRHGSDRYNR